MAVGFPDWATAINYSDLIALLLSAVVAWAAWTSTRLSSRLAENELRPDISVYLQLDEYHRFFLDLVVRNGGRGVARNVTFAVSPDIPIREGRDNSRLTQIAFIGSGLGHLGSGQEMRTFLSSYRDFVKVPIEIVVECDSAGVSGKSQRIKERFIIDVTEFDGIRAIGTPPLTELARSVKNIADDIRQIKQGSFQSNLTVTVRRRYFMSEWLNRSAERWFGPRYLGIEYTPFKHFSNELMMAIKQKLIRGK